MNKKVCALSMLFFVTINIHASKKNIRLKEETKPLLLNEIGLVEKKVFSQTKKLPNKNENEFINIKESMTALCKINQIIRNNQLKRFKKVTINDFNELQKNLFKILQNNNQFFSKKAKSLYKNNNSEGLKRLVKKYDSYKKQTEKTLLEYPSKDFFFIDLFLLLPIFDEGDESYMRPKSYFEINKDIIRSIKIEKENLNKNLSKLEKAPEFLILSNKKNVKMKEINKINKKGFYLVKTTTEVEKNWTSKKIIQYDLGTTKYPEILKSLIKLNENKDYLKSEIKKTNEPLNLEIYY